MKPQCRATARLPQGAAAALSTMILAIALAGSARAGECPDEHVKANAQKPGPTAHRGVSDTVIGAIDLAQEAPKLANHKFRLRRLVVQPGGTVAWHSHAERPAIIYVVSGSIVEYRSTCAVPITHKAGDVAVETHAVEHWWKNTTGKPAVLLSADILGEHTDQHTM